MNWKVGDIGIYTFNDGDEFHFKIRELKHHRGIIEWVKCKPGFNWEGQRDPIDLNVSNVRLSESTIVARLIEEYGEKDT